MRIWINNVFCSSEHEEKTTIIIKIIIGYIFFVFILFLFMSFCLTILFTLIHQANLSIYHYYPLD